MLKDCSAIKVPEATCPVARQHIPEHLHVHNLAWTWGMIIKNSVFDGCSEIRTHIRLVREKLFFSNLYKNNVQISISPVMLKGD
jgi:hypothetical protein